MKTEGENKLADINVIMSGDFADPSILKDGSGYYLTHSSNKNYPGLLIWYSKDLLHWTRVNRALIKDVGEVWAPELIKFKDLYYIYFSAGGGIYVITAHNPVGHWTDPVKIDGIDGIDPGHVVGPDGARYLYINEGRVVQLSPDGLSVKGKGRKSI